MDVLSTQDYLEQRVGPLFISGVKALESFVEVLQNEAIVGEVTPAEVDQVASKLRPHVTEAYNEFSAAKEEAAFLNAKAYSEVEVAVAELSEIREQLQQIKAAEDELSTKVNTLMDDVAVAEKEVENAINDLNAAEPTLQTATATLEEKIKEQEDARMAGMISNAIPLIGPIGGFVVAILDLTVFQEAVKAAENAVQSAQNNVQSRQDRLEESKATLESSQVALNDKIGERAAKQDELARTERQYEEVKGTQDRVLGISTKLKRVVTFTATTLGRTKVLEGEFEEFYSLDTIYEPLKAIAEHFKSAELDNFQMLSGKLDLVAAEKKFQLIYDKSSAKL